MVFMERTLKQLSSIPLKGGCYIFRGEKGLGKKSASIEVASRLLSTPLDKLMVHPDYYELSPEKGKGSIGIDDLQELREFASLVPVVAECKICVIDDANLLTNEAQNSLLKLLEEQTVSLIVILIAHENMLDTISSRSKEILFYPLEEEQFSNALSSLVGDIDAVASCLACGRIGFYLDVIKDKEYLQTVRQSLQWFCNPTAERDGLFQALHLLKEKDKDNFFEKYSANYVIAFLHVLRVEVFAKSMERKYDPSISSSICSIESIHTDADALLKAYGITSNAISLLNVRNGFNKNDFFGLICSLCELVKKER